MTDGTAEGDFFDTADESPRTRGGGSHYQPRPQIALLLLVLFVGSLILVAHYVSPVSVAGQLPPGVTSTLPTTTLPPQHVPRQSVRVQVANGTSVPGLAKTYSDNLQTLNWNVLPPANGPRVVATEIYYRPGFEWAAAEIAGPVNATTSALRPLGSAAPIANIAGDDVIVILGPDAVKN